MKQQYQITTTAHSPNFRRAVRILLIEDEENYSRFVEKVLIGSGTKFQFELTRTRDLLSAISELRIKSFDVILLDLNLADSSGLETLEKLNVSGFVSPIIVLTDQDDQTTGLQSIALGAQDCLVKHVISSQSLLRSILYAVERRKSELSRLRWAAIRDFSATLANDLQVPLVGTRNLLDVLSSASELDSHSRDEILCMLKRSNAEQIELVVRLLEVYQYETKQLNLNFSEFNLNSLIDEVLEKLDSEINARGARVKLDIPSDFSVWADLTAFHKVILNLLDNAIRYGASDLIELTARRNEGSTTIKVRTESNIIPPEELRLFFMNLWQGIPGKKYVPSVGLGLYLCHQIVDLHYGEIKCESTIDKGTTFTVVLPGRENSQSFSP